jgi:hypothetical protein
MAGRIGVNIVTDGLVLYLDAANSISYVSGSTVWNDLSRNGNNGTLVNGPTFDSSNGGSIVFNGNTDYVSISNSINPTNITLDFFYKTSVNWFYEYLASNARDCCGSYKGYELRIEQSIPKFTIWNSTSSSISGNLITLNQIHHISATYDGIEQKIYQNGILVNTENTTLGIGNPPSYNLAIGAMGHAPSVYDMTGNIYTSKIYNRALSAQEILQNYNATKSRYGL